MSRPAPSRQDGFSLVELIVAIAVLGILSAITVLIVGGSATTDPQSCAADLQSVQTASDSYYSSNNNTYAPDIATLVTARNLKEAPQSTTAYQIVYSYNPPASGGTDLKPSITAQHTVNGSLVPGCPT